MKEKGVAGLDVESPGRIDQYKPSMDNHIIDKF
jgi:hypothetical protein